MWYNCVNKYPCDAQTSRGLTNALGGALMTDIIPQPKHNRISGVYEILNTVNGHRYIGSSCNIQNRWREHKRDLNNSCHHSPYLQRSWTCHGGDCFTFSVLECCEKEHLIEREQFYIDNLNPIYNTLPQAGSRLGAIVTEETRIKFRKRMSGKGNVMYGKHHTVISIQQMSDSKKGTPAWNKGRKGLYSASDETRRKISESQKGRTAWNKGIKTGKPAWNTGLSVGWNKGKKGLQVSHNKGKHLSDETKRKLSEAHTGLKLSEEHKAKISQSLIGNKRTLGCVPTEEARRNMSEAQKRVWMEKRANQR